MPTETLRSPVDLLNPDMNGGRYTPISLCRGLDFVFLHGGTTATPSGTGSPSADLAAKVRLFGDPLLEAFSIEETSASGSVPFLRATNNTTFDVVLIAGQLVKGGKQNRGVNTDILVCAGQTAQVPVTCVEQGRWSGRPGSRFQHGGVEPINIRSEKFRHVSSNRRSESGFHADQSKVWSDIGQMSNCLRAPSASGDLLSSLEQIKGRRGRRTEDERRLEGPSANRDENGNMDLDMELERLQHQTRMLQDEAQHTLERLRGIVAQGETELMNDHRLRLDHLLRELLNSQREVEHLRDLRISRGNAPTVTSDMIAKVDAAARGAMGMLVFFNGEFLAGDIFAKPEWFATFYGDLRDSALMTWDMVAMRHATTGRQMDAASAEKAHATARSIVNDALRGSWTDRPTAAHGRAQLLEHPYLEGASLADTNGTPLHVLVGSKRTPEVLRA